MTLRTEHIPGHIPEHIADERLILFADGELTADETAQVREHLESCVPCRERVEAMQAILSSIFSGGCRPEPTEEEWQRMLLRSRLAQEMDQGKTSVPAGVMRAGWNAARTRGLALGCALALLAITGFEVSRVVRLLRQTNDAQMQHSEPQAGMLPNPFMTPGLTHPVTLAQVCAEDRDEVVRSVPVDLQQRVFQEYGMKDAQAKDFEVDYLITPGLGGSEDVRNLWPEPHAEPVWNSYVKDQLEDHLHHMVCHGELSLGDAQKEIAGNWITAYKKYFHSERPLASRELSKL
jgi:hypothetical protein